MSLGCLFDVVNEFRSSKPAQLSVNFTFFCRPSNLSAECLEVSLILTPFFLVDLVMSVANAAAEEE
jgi:hypothetical protein